MAVCGQIKKIPLLFWYRRQIIVKIKITQIEDMALHPPPNYFPLFKRRKEV